MIFIMKKQTKYLKKYFNLCLYQSILFFTIKTATKIISYNQLVIIILEISK